MDQTKSEEPSQGQTKSKKNKIAGWSACALWVLSIILSFAIAPNSPFIWIPDAVLLIGFFPLIWICPYSIVWIIFGVLNALIGWFLLLLTCIPDSALPAQSIGIKKHLAEYHPYWSWILLGLFVALCGTVRICVNTIGMISKKKNKSAN